MASNGLRLVWRYGETVFLEHGLSVLHREICHQGPRRRGIMRNFQHCGRVNDRIVRTGRRRGHYPHFVGGARVGGVDHPGVGVAGGNEGKRLDAAGWRTWTKEKADSFGSVRWAKPLGMLNHLHPTDLEPSETPWPEGLGAKRSTVPTPDEE